ncbi:MAG TPA: DUF6174 domain-containing protein [Gemmatimonadaceae bacterium]|nr:DUF6174 domain-containing protein [Gemmatimonadaceae bacterium]HRQ77638.1 DUF6174 domain-containing protein [Gemmatimonadaceae bacterium]
MRITGLLLFVSLASLACSEVLAPRLDEGDLATMQARWEERRPANYTFDVTQWSEWVSPTTLRITVRNHQFHSARLAEAPSTVVDQAALTLDSLFALATRLQPDTSAMLHLRFDSRTGMISRLYVDWPLWADDSFGYLVKRFVAQ